MIGYNTGFAKQVFRSAFPIITPAYESGYGKCHKGQGEQGSSAFGVFGILWGIIREIVNGVFRVVIGVIVAILSTIAYFGFILWLLTL